MAVRGGGGSHPAVRRAAGGAFAGERLFVLSSHTGPWWLGPASAGGSAAEGLLGAAVLRRLRFHPDLARSRDAIGLVAAAAVGPLAMTVVLLPTAAALNWDKVGGPVSTAVAW